VVTRRNPSGQHNPRSNCPNRTRRTPATRNTGSRLHTSRSRRCSRRVRRPRSAGSARSSRCLGIRNRRNPGTRHGNPSALRSHRLTRSNRRRRTPRPCSSRPLRLPCRCHRYRLRSHRSRRRSCQHPACRHDRRHRPRRCCRPMRCLRRWRCRCRLIRPRPYPRGHWNSPRQSRSHCLRLPPCRPARRRNRPGPALSLCCCIHPRASRPTQRPNPDLMLPCQEVYAAGISGPSAASLDAVDRLERRTSQ
jgi:hypothetical protein